MTNETIYQVFEKECQELVIDARFCKALHQYQVGFITKNKDHIEFFGGHLLGVHTVKFMPADRDSWFLDIIKVDDGPLENHLRTLPVIDPKFKVVSSDTMNLSCVWLTHKIFKSSLPADVKHTAMMDVMLVLQYKFMTSLLHQYFRFPPDKDTANTVYAMLSKRYLIKEHGTWKNVFNFRSEEIIGKESIWGDVIEKMDKLKPWSANLSKRDLDNDERVVDMLNDIQGRIRGIVKNIYAVLVEVHNSGMKITTTSSITEFDGESILRDKSNNLFAYERYVSSIISDKNSFIKQELVNVVTKVITSMSPRLFEQTLTYMSDNYHQRGSEKIKAVIHDTLIHSFEYMLEKDNRDLVSRQTDIATLITRLKGVYMASRSTNPMLIKMREETEDIVEKATDTRNQSQQAAVRTGVLLYIVLVAVTMKHYVNSV